MNFQTWQGSFAFDLIINPNHPLHESNESELAWTCLRELRSKALSFPQKPFSFLQGQDVVVTRHPCCLLSLSPSWWNPSIATLEVLLQLWFLGIQSATQLISALFYEWFMEAWRTLRISTFSVFQMLVQWEGHFSCQWEPERPDGLFWQDSMSVKEAPRRLQSKWKYKCMLALTSTGNDKKNIFTWFYSSVSC